MSRSGMGGPGDWMDEWGACKTCGGEIPHGHMEECDVYKMEKTIRDAKTLICRWMDMPDEPTPGEGLVSTTEDFVAQEAWRHRMEELRKDTQAFLDKED